MNQSDFTFTNWFRNKSNYSLYTLFLESSTNTILIIFNSDLHAYTWNFSFLSSPLTITTYIDSIHYSSFNDKINPKILTTVIYRKYVL